MPTDGCLTSKSRQEQLAHSVAMSAPDPPSPERDQTQYLGAQLAHREVQLEYVRSERDSHFVQEKNYLRTCVYSSAKRKIGNPGWSAKRKTMALAPPINMMHEVAHTPPIPFQLNALNQDPGKGWGRNSRRKKKVPGEKL